MTNTYFMDGSGEAQMAANSPSKAGKIVMTHQKKKMNATKKRKENTTKKVLQSITRLHIII